MNAPRILILGGRDSSIDAAKSLGLRTAMFQHAALATEHQRRLADEYHLMPHEDRNGILGLAERLHRQDPFAAVVSFNEAWLSRVGEVKERLDIAGNERRASEVTRDKLAFRHLLNERGISPLPFCGCRSEEAVRAFLAEIGRPIIVKPSRGASSAGVALVKNADQIAQAFTRVGTSPEWMRDAPNPIIAEAFVDGPEFSVESYSVNGQHRIIDVTEKLTSGTPMFIETGHQMPARIDQNIRVRIDEVVTAMLDAIGQWTGPAHTEVRLREGEPIIIESQTRFGGDQIWEMVKLIHGIDFPTRTMADLLGIAAEIPRPVWRAMAIRFILLPAGRVNQVTGLEEASSMPGVVRVKLAVGIGSIVPELRSSPDRSGYVFAGGDSPDQAIERAVSAMRRLSFWINGVKIDGHNLSSALPS